MRQPLFKIGNLVEYQSGQGPRWGTVVYAKPLYTGGVNAQVATYLYALTGHVRTFEEKELRLKAESSDMSGDDKEYRG